MVPKNTDTLLFIDTTPSGETPTYARIGEGVVSATPSNNPTVDTKHYINHKGPTNTVTAVAKQIALSMERYTGDVANDFLAGLDGAIGDDVKTTLVKVDSWEGSDEAALPAKKYEVVVAVNNNGTVQGGGVQDMDVTLYCNGDPVEGTFNTSTKAFTATA